MNATIRFLRLLWIDFRRVHGYVTMVLVAILMPYATYDQERVGVVLWADADRELFATVLSLTTIGGGYGAWVAGRIARRRLSAQDAVLPVPPGRTTAIALVAAGCWMTLAYALAAVWFYQEPLREATWGSPNLALAIPVLGATWMALGLGGVLGTLHRSPLIPPLVTAGIFGLQIWAQVDSWKLGFLELVPRGYIESNRWWGEFDGFRPPGLGAYAVTMVAGAGAALTSVLLVRRWSVVRVAIIAALMAITVPSAQRTLAARYETGPDGLYESPVERICERAPMTDIDVCLHPAFTNVMGGVIAAIDGTYGMVAGFAGVPKSVYQVSDSGSFGLVGDRLELTLSDGRIDYLDTYLVFAIFPDAIAGPAWEGPDPVQCFVATVLARQVSYGTYACEYDLMGIEPGTYAFDVGARQAELARIPAKVEAWHRLTPQEQRAWLEANWDALRAGELTLEDLP